MAYRSFFLISRPFMGVGPGGDCEYNDSPHTGYIELFVMDNITLTFQDQSNDFYELSVTSEWDFGDGSPIAYGTSVNHQFVKGYYTVTLISTGALGSIASSSMRLMIQDHEVSNDYFMDLNLPESTESFGTNSDPFCKYVLNKIFDGVYREYISSKTVLIKGNLTFPTSRAPYGYSSEPAVRWEYYMPTIRGTLTMKAWDKANYGPPTWYNPDYMVSFSDDYYIEAYPLLNGSDIVFEDLVISQAGIEFDAQNSDDGLNPRHMIFKGCYFDFTSYMQIIRWAEISNDGNVDFYGCTFMFRIGGYPLLDINQWGSESNQSSRFYDCVFISEDQSGIDGNGIFIDMIDKMPIEFHNCYFSTGLKIAWEFSYVWGWNSRSLDAEPTVPYCTFGNCHFGHDFGNIFPTAETATVALKDTFRATNFNVPKETDPAILQRWVDNDYNTGLFGETRLGAGAFYFFDITIDFTADVLSGPRGTAVTFTDSSIGEPSSWLWDFGDGQTSTEQNPVHTYNRAGLYTVTLAVNGGAGIKVRYDYITITTDFSVDFSADVTLGIIPTIVRFTPTVTGGDVTRYLWDFGDGQTSTDRAPIHTYSVYGTHTVALTVWDVYGDPTRVQKQDFIKLGSIDFEPRVVSGRSPVSVQVEDRSRAPAGLGFTGWQWDFGDGSTGMGPSPSHTYTTAGSYTITGKVAMTALV